MDTCPFCQGVCQFTGSDPEEILALSRVGNVAAVTHLREVRVTLLRLDRQLLWTKIRGDQS